MKIKVIKFRYQRPTGDSRSQRRWYRTNRHSMEELSKDAQEFLKFWNNRNDNSKLQ